MSYLDLTTELAGNLPGLSPFLAQKYINRAWIDICNARTWSWLTQDAAVFCPAQITDGTVSITKGSASVTCDSDASTALLVQDALALPTLTNLQIRFSPSSPQAGQVYNIVAVDQTNPAAVILTLDRVVVETTNASSEYQCYRCYVAPPAISGAGFLSWESFTDVVNGWTLGRDYTSGYLDVRDPQRQAQGLAYYLADYEATRTANVVTGATAPNPNQNAGVPNYELWPHPTQGQTFYVRMKLKGQAFVQPTDTQPTNIIDDQMIIQRALGRYVLPFAWLNKTHYPTMKLGAGDYQMLVASANGNYNELLITAKRQDDEQALKSVYNRGHGLRGGKFGTFKGTNVFPIDSNFLQSHLVRL